MNQADKHERRTWGTLGRAGFWVNSFMLSFVAPPFLVCACAMVGLLVFAVFVQIPLHNWYDLPSSGLAATFCLVFTLIGTWLALGYWIRRSPAKVTLRDDAIVRYSITGTKTFPYDKILRAFVTAPTHEHERSTRLCLHLSTRWRDMTIPLDRIVERGPAHAMREEFDLLLVSLSEKLERHGRQLELGVPRTSVTHDGHPALFDLHWPHRRVLLRRALRADSDELPADLDKHRDPKAWPSMKLAWMLRPTPYLFSIFLVIPTIVLAAMEDLAPAFFALPLLGFVSALSIPAWNHCKGQWLALRAGEALLPETLVGQHRINHKPTLYRPAPGCRVDMETQKVHRPDGKVHDFAHIKRVAYGPPPMERHRVQDSLQRAIAMTSWELALHTQDESAQIYTNASVDIVRYGDLDAGYAAFNWTLARNLAKASGAELVLAHERLPRDHVGRSLVVRLASDVNQYDPEPLRQQLSGSTIKSRVHIHQDEETFCAWGPLSRLPEHCASPPLWRSALAILALALIPFGYPLAGLFAGYFIVTAIGQWLTSRHFQTPGFVMDRAGVWVRGVCIPWESVEESTLMPVAPGPVLFCGENSVLVVGHLGSSYLERAWLGCEAYRWMRNNLQEFGIDAV